MLILPYLGAPMDKLHIPAFVMNRLSSGLPEEVGPHLKNMILVGFKYGVTQSRQLISTSEANRSAVRSTVEAIDCPFCSRPENAGFLGKGLGHVCTMKVGCVSDPQLESILEKGSQFRNAAPVDFVRASGKTYASYIETTLEPFVMECAHRFGVSAAALRGTVQELASEIDEGISSISLGTLWLQM